MTGPVMPTYARMPIAFERGEGPWLWGTDGKRYLDAISGIAVCNLGHAHPAIAHALCDQASKLVHTSNLYGITNQSKLAEALCEISGLDCAFFCNSGAEANEAALKLARLWGHNQGIQRPKVIVMENSFHGRTLFTLSATGNNKVQAGFEPLVDTFVRVPFDDIGAIYAQQDPEIVAILVEPVQGEGGVRIPQQDYLQSLRKLCDQKGWLLMLDEVQTGMARTGRWFAFQHSGIHPDVMTLAKGLGNGVPIGACLAKGAAAEVLTQGKHGSTFGGNPLSSRAALAVIDTMTQEKSAERAQSLGQLLVDQFKLALNHNPKIRDIRGKGLMIGIELDQPCQELTHLAFNQGLLINVTADKVIRLLPPLILSDEDAMYLVNTLAPIINEFTAH